MIVNNKPAASSGGGEATDPLALGATTLYNDTSPTTPTEGILLYGVKRANRRMIGFKTMSGRTERVQPWLGANNRYEHSTSPGIATAFNSNMTMTTLPAFTAVQLTAGGAYFSTQKRAAQVITTATGIAYNFNAQSLCLRGTSGSVRGGFHASWRFGFGALASAGDFRFFCGMRSSNTQTPLAAPTSVNPSTLTHIIGMGKDSADTTFTVMANGASGTAQKIALTSNPAAIPVINNASPIPIASIMFYQFELFCTSNDTQFGYRLTRWDNAGVESVAEGLITGTPNAAGGIPMDNATFQPFIWIGNTTAVSNTLHYSQFFMETD